MKYTILTSVALFTLGLTSSMAHAQLFKCVDADGKITYSNGASSKGCKQLSNEQAVSTINMRANASPASFPKVTDEAQRERDSSRRKVLENELSNEQSALEEARKALEEQEETGNGSEMAWPVVGADGVGARTNCRTGKDGKVRCPGRNYQKVLERLQPYRDAIERHERNIEALTQELSALR